MTCDVHSGLRYTSFSTPMYLPRKNDKLLLLEEERIMMLKKAGLTRLFVTSAEEVLLTLIKDELANTVIAERVGVTEQHVSRVLKVLEKHGLIFRRSHGTKRLNRLTPLGMALALKIQQKVNVIADIFGS